MSTSYTVVNRHGRVTEFDYNKIHSRILDLSKDLAINVNRVIMEFITTNNSSLANGNMKTSKIDELLAEVAYKLIVDNYNYSVLAARLAVTNLSRNLPDEFSRIIAVQYFYNWRISDMRVPIPAPSTFATADVSNKSLIRDDVYAFVYRHRRALDAMVNHNVVNISYIGFKTMCDKKYLIRLYGDKMRDLYMYETALDSPIPSVGSDLCAAAFNIGEILEPATAASAVARPLITFDELDSKIVETPSDLYMRVAVEVCMRKCTCKSANHDGLRSREDLSENYDDLVGEFKCAALVAIHELYRMMWIDNKFVFATPMLLNACCRGSNNFISCFLMSMSDDSIEGIYKTLADTATLAKNAGGIGMSVTNVRATGTYIKGTNSLSNGLIPMLSVYNQSSNYVNQGGNKRPGSIAYYIEPWHADVPQLIAAYNLHDNTDSIKKYNVKDLFMALWVNDLFMKRVATESKWTFMSPDTCPGLDTAYGADFERLYLQYESEGRGLATMDAMTLWNDILEMKVKTGLPYICFKDTANEVNNQMHLGTLKSSNLCTEIYEYHDRNETACCTLASISLDRFVVASTREYSVAMSDGKTRSYKETTKRFDFESFGQFVQRAVYYLDSVIDISSYSIPSAKVSNNRHRPLSLGVRGLADVFIQLEIPYDSLAAVTLNREIFGYMYYMALRQSIEMARECGPYSSFTTSPAARGVLHLDMFNCRQHEMCLVDSEIDAGIVDRVDDLYDPNALTQIKGTNIKLDWNAVRADIVAVGLRNSLLVGLMPTESTSLIMQCSKSFEPLVNIMYLKKAGNAGNCVIANTYVAQLLTEHGLWNSRIIDEIIDNKSVARCAAIPQRLREVLRSSTEIDTNIYIKMCADRQPYVDQGQSMNIRMTSGDIGELSGYMFRAWLSGLKTGIYYLNLESGAQLANLVGEEIKVPVPAPAIAVVPRSTQNRQSVYDSILEHEYAHTHDNNSESDISDVEVSYDKFDDAPTQKKQSKATPRANKQRSLSPPVVCTREMREAGCESCAL